MKKHSTKNNKKSKNTPIKREKGKFISIIIAFCLPVLLYLHTVNYGFTHFDDNEIISKNITFLNNFDNVNKAFLTDAFNDKSSYFYRPLQTLSYMIDIHLSGVDKTWMYHLSNVLLLGLISMMLFLLIKRFQIPSKLALVSTLIFCVHPLFVSTVAWIPARGDMLLAFFSLLSFWSFIKFLQNKKKRYLLLNSIAFTIALFCKETAALLPLLFIIYYFAFRKERRFDKIYFINIIIYFVSGVFWFWLRSKALSGSSEQSNRFGIMSVISNLRTIPESLAKFILPYKIVILPIFTIFATITGFVIITLIAFAFIKNKERLKREKTFFILWYLILMLPPMIFKPRYIDYLDHRFLLPLIGILLYILFILPEKWIEKVNNKSYWLIAFILVLSLITFNKSRSYFDSFTFYDSALSQNSHSFLANFNRGIVNTELGNSQDAIEDYNKALAIDSNNEDALNNRGYLKSTMQHYKEAINDLNKAISICPTYGEGKAYTNRGSAKLNIGDTPGAIADYSKAIEINPNYFGFYLNRANARFTLKDLKGTIVDCDIALKLNPNFEDALNIKTKAQQELQKIRLSN